MKSDLYQVNGVLRIEAYLPDPDYRGYVSDGLGNPVEAINTPSNDCENAARSPVGRRNTQRIISLDKNLLLAACKPLILLDFHKSFNDTRTIEKTA